MFRWIALLLCLLLCFPAAAETVPEDVSFIGLWQPDYYIRNGKVLSDEEAAAYPDAFFFSDKHMQYMYDSVFYENIPYEINGNSCIAGSLLFIMEGSGLAVAHASDYSVILRRVDPMMLSNPFLGTWNVQCGKSGGKVEALSTYGTSATVTFTEDQVTYTTDDMSQSIPCTYANGKCSIVEEGSITIGSITADGLLYLENNDSGSHEVLILTRADEEIPEMVKPYLGTWRVLTTFGMEELQDVRFLFERACVTQINGDERTSSLCFYYLGYCQMGEDDIKSPMCTIDNNGLMTIRYSVDKNCWLVRENETAE